MAGASEPDQAEILLRPAVGPQVRHPGLDHGRGDNRIVWIHLDAVGATFVDDRHCGQRRWRGSHAFRPFLGGGALMPTRLFREEMLSVHQRVTVGRSYVRVVVSGGKKSSTTRKCSGAPT